jgi:glycosyltransferase involved in cell wall biosynthesis
MRPLVIITVFNRARETRETLIALEATTDLNEVEVVIVDNGSIDGASDVANEWAARHVAKKVRVLKLATNIGCPRALNLALAARKAGQAVIKIDNDVRITTPGWLAGVQDLVAGFGARYGPVAMVGANYDGALEGRSLGQVFPDGYVGPDIFAMGHIIGHAVYHTGAFMDRVGYFDVLSDEHIYGFEDLILSHKARALGWESLVWDGWRIENIQRHNALGAGRDAHVEAMRPLYNQRIQALAAGGTTRTCPDGCPGVS